MGDLERDALLQPLPRDRSKRNEFNSQLTRRESICDWEHERRATTDGVRKDSLLASGGVSAFTGCDYSMPSAALLRKLSTPLEAKLRGRRSVLHSCAAANKLSLFLKVL